MSAPVDSAFDPTSLGINHTGKVWANLPAAALTEHIVRRDEATLTDLGAVAALTGKRTGRLPKDKFTVKERAVADHIDWTANQPMSPETFARMRDLVRRICRTANYLSSMALSGADPVHRVPIRVVTEKAWHSLFARCLFPAADSRNS